MAKKKVTDSPKNITQKQLTRIFDDIKKHKSKEERFCFLLGAGASRSSGIKTGWELSQTWYEELKHDLSPSELTSWEKEIGFEEKRVGEFYTRLYDKRFESNQFVGYEIFKNLMENIEPGLGYAVLSQVLTREKHNFVITTNFDYLVEDAIRTFTSKKPFSAGHETLAEFVSLQTERPTIIKVHRDLFLKPFNDEVGTQKLKEQWSTALLPIVKNFNLLVIGYGGNDGSLMDYLSTIEPEERKAIYWCIRKGDTLNDKINSLLTKKDYVVAIDGFDEFMFGLHDVLEYEIFKELDNPDEHHFVKETKERITGLNEKRRELFEKVKDTSQDTVKEVSEEIKEIFTGSLKYLFDALEEEDLDKKELIYEDGLEKYPNDFYLIANYANNLYNSYKDYDQAEVYYKKALELESNNTSIIGNYAIFLSEIRKNYDKAEIYFLKALKLSPNDADFNGNYANFLSSIRKNYNQAEVYYKKTLELDPLSANKNSNYAHHLIISKQNFKESEKYINIAFNIIKEEPLNIFLELWFYRYAHYPKWRDQAEKEIEKLLKKGVRSIGWHFDLHIAIAEKNGHSDIRKLKEFVERITSVH